jgi:hypothetical protein
MHAGEAIFDELHERWERELGAKQLAILFARRVQVIHDVADDVYLDEERLMAAALARD